MPMFDLLETKPFVMHAIDLLSVEWDDQAPVTLADPPARLTDLQIMLEVRWLAVMSDRRELAGDDEAELPTMAALRDRLDALEAEVGRRAIP